MAGQCTRFEDRCLLAEHLCQMSDKLAELGLGCAGCPMSQMETIEEGALAHGINPDALIEELKSSESDE